MGVGLGFGALKHMNDTLRHNRELLGKKKTMRDRYKEEVARQTASSGNPATEVIRQGVIDRVRRDKINSVIARIVSGAFLALIVGFLVWVFSRMNFSTTVSRKLYDKDHLFRTVIYDENNGLALKMEHYPSGPRAAETLLKNGHRHQRAESYYESGEQFRSALYNYDTLITEVFLYKTGDTIRNFPNVNEGNIVRVKLLNQKQMKKIEFLLYDNKILGGSYKESEYPTQE